jgi:hypothetical protein
LRLGLKIELNFFVLYRMQAVANYSLLIPCFCAWGSQKCAIHAAFHEQRKKFPVIFPVIEQTA